MRYAAVVGPTCVGKTDFVTRLYGEVPFEVINLDSIQIYDFFRVGSGRSDLPDHIPSHLYGIIDPREKLTPALYIDLVRQKLKELARRKVRFLFEGGSLSLLRPLSETFELNLVGLRPPPANLISHRIDARIDRQLKAFLREVSTAFKKGYENTFVMQTPVIYQPVSNHLQGKSTWEECRKEVKRNLLRMTKRQMKEYETYPISWIEEPYDVCREVAEILFDGGWK